MEPMSVYSCSNCLEPIQVETCDQSSQQISRQVNHSIIKRVKRKENELGEIFRNASLLPTELSPLPLALLPIRRESLRNHIEPLMQGVVDVADAFGAAK